MLARKVAAIAILILIVFTANIHAQNSTPSQSSAVSSVTGSITPEGTVRMIAHGEVLQIRLEIYSTAGDLVSDSGLRQGNIIDWKQSDAAQPLTDGSYLTIVTVKDFKGTLTQRTATLSLQAGQLNLQKTEVSPVQTQILDARRSNQKTARTDADDAISILRDGKERSVVVAAHDGTDGQVSSTNGSLTFRTGNVFSNREQEQMRITPEGRVGIGTKTPEATLDVAGTVKARGGIQFEDGSVLSSAKDLSPSKDAPSGSAGANNLSGTNIITAINDPATVGVINDNRVSLNLARVAAANSWSSLNTFGAGLSLNNTQITNVGNPVNGGDAVKKNYFDISAVRFLPAVQQVSVGDANGTAPLINLRGQSTCCGPTTGFADFKVFQNGSFVATGNLGIGTIPMQGSGYRTMWYTYKGAFRSGYADTEWDDANVGFFSWAGGSNSKAAGLYSLAFGDTNLAESTSSIVFGSGNQVKGAGFSAGAGNRVCDTYGVALGNNAKSGGPYINGKCDPDSFNIHGLAAVAIGYNVTADQDHSFAFGNFASTNGFSGSFIWGDGAATSSVNTFKSTANNEFAARASGGFRFRTNLAGTTGCNLPSGSGVFNCTSSRTTKENFLLVDGDDVLSRLRNIEVSTWNYISEGRTVRHMGPMAEDFYKAFQLGTGNTSIGVQDLTGVSLAAIKELNRQTDELKQKTAEVEQLREEVNQLRSANSDLERRLATIEQLLVGQAQQQSSTKLH